ncbi:MAG: hypothetical protein WAM73_10765 [Desulfobacterales bacterium]
MIPIYFPHTFLTRPAREAIFSCFSKVAVYQPGAGDIVPVLREIEKTGRIELRVPIAADEEKLASLLTDFRNWAALHRDKRGIDSAYIKTRRNTVPFFDDTSGAHILADIKGGGPSAPPTSAMRLLNARLLLRIAQEMDVQNDSLETDLRRSAELERSLFAHLRGGETNLRPGTALGSVGGTGGADYMIEERVGAWALLAAADAGQRGPDAAGIFVTASGSVLDYVTERQPMAVKIFETAGVPVTSGESEVLEKWRQELLPCLVELAVAERAVDAAERLRWPPVPVVEGPAGWATLKVYLLAGQSPGAFLRGLSSPPVDPAGAGEPDARLKNTVVAAVERPDAD